MTIFRRIRNADAPNYVPVAMTCPLTLTWFEDPVITPRGTSYERTAIEEWLEDNATDPFSREALTRDQLLPNHALREALNFVLDHHAEVALRELPGNTTRSPKFWWLPHVTLPGAERVVYDDGAAVVRAESRPSLPEAEDPRARATKIA